MKGEIKRRERRTEVASEHALHLPRFRRQEKVAVAVRNHLSKTRSCTFGKRSRGRSTLYQAVATNKWCPWCIAPPPRPVLL